ncbi:MAG: PucR family transcriptional regulator [Solobacterium sp.]|nr:PucR family transcriptional regulator [Solobacterium sp.]
MGYTIEDLMSSSQDKYEITFMAGQKGWSNSISWILLIEDINALRNFKGKDLAITTGFGFSKESQLLALVSLLVKLRASGLIINTGMYIHEIPQSVIDICNENDLPLLTVPWHIQLFDMIKDLNIRVLLQGMADEQISAAFIEAIEKPKNSSYRTELLPYFDVDGDFQVFVLETGDLDTMDTVERRRLSFQIQIYLESISHNASFFYYDSCFVVVVNNVPENTLHEIIASFEQRVQQRMPRQKLAVGVGSILRDLDNLTYSYKRARAAARKALAEGERIVWFDDMGTERLLYLVSDPYLIREMGPDLLKPLIDYDAKNSSDYVRLLETYLRTDGSIQETASQMYLHRNTVIYRMNNIKKLLNSNLDTTEEKMKHLIACRLLNLK